MAFKNRVNPFPKEVDEMTPSPRSADPTHSYTLRNVSYLARCSPMLVTHFWFAYALNSVLFWLLTLCGQLHICPNEMISLCMVEVHGISRAAPCSPLLGCASLPALHTPQPRHPGTSFQTFLSAAYMSMCLSLTHQVLCNQVHTDNAHVS